MTEASILYLSGLSIGKIRKKLNIGSGKVYQMLSQDNIKIRGQSEIKHIFTKDQKDKISKGLINFYKENPDRHPWKKSDKFVSKPCEIFKAILSDNKIKFVSEYSIFPNHSYSIDIAMPEYKIGFEINGNQHYNKDSTLKEYYLNRETYIESFGWKLFQIHYTICFNVNQVLKIVNDAIIDREIKYDFDYNNYLIGKINYKKNKKASNTKCKCGAIIFRTSNQCVDCFNIKQRKVERPSKDKLLIDIDKLGYSGTGRKYGVSDNAIRKWLK